MIREKAAPQGFGNKTDMTAALDTPCGHGDHMLRSCPEVRCRKIKCEVLESSDDGREIHPGVWKLRADPKHASVDPERIEAAQQLGAYKTAVGVWRAERPRERDNDRGEEQSDAGPEAQPARPLRIVDLFADPFVQLAARQFGALDDREDRVLGALLEDAQVRAHVVPRAEEDVAWRIATMARTGFVCPPAAVIPAGEKGAPLVHRIALRVGCSDPPVREALEALGRRFVTGADTPKPPDGWSRPGTLKVVTRARRRLVYVCREDRIGAWRQQGWEWLPPAKARAALKTTPPERIQRERGRERKIHESQMRALWAALAHAMTQDEATSPTTLEGVTRTEWRHNLQWARRKVRAFGTLFGQRDGGPLTFVKALDALANKGRRRPFKACKTCRTPLLRGCRLGGTAVTHAREYCDKACTRQHACRERSHGR
jgi:hypothetical protein